MIAIISDINGNLEALEAVLAAATKEGADRIICLGDVVGYGPNPVECVRLARQFHAVIAGDWEQAIVAPDPDSWNPRLYKQILATRARIAEESDGPELLAWLGSLVDSHRVNDFLLVHGTLQDCREFIFPEDVYNPQKLDRIIAAAGSSFINGHTHLPGIHFRNLDGEWAYLEGNSAPETGVRIQPSMICNVGSVGRPRDGDPRASYALLDGQTIFFRRVDYDFHRTRQKIRDGDDDNLYGDRLCEGR